jgi:hypothetical protein
VYFEKRYIAANFVIVWIALLASIRTTKTKYRFLAQALLVGFALVFTFFFFARTQVYPIKVALRDLLSRHEHEWSADYVLAQRLTALGLRPGDKIAFIGSSINAYWAHLAGVRIVAEVPLLYGRTERPLNNALINDTRQIQAFWEAGPESKDKVLRAFRDAGAVMAVADGYFCSSLASQWARVLPESQEHIPRFDEHDYSHINSRYYPLRPLTRQ